MWPATNLPCSALASSLDAGAFPHILFVVFLPFSQRLLVSPRLFSEIVCLNILISFHISCPIFYLIAFIFARGLLFSDEKLLDKWFKANPSKNEKEIRKIVSEISFSKWILASTLESKIVQDADRLDAIGAIGIARVFTYGGAIWRLIYAIDESSSISYFDEKLFKIKDKMNTEIGNIKALDRESYMKDFLE